MTRRYSVRAVWTGLAGLTAIATAAAPSSAQRIACSPARSEAADAAIGRVTSWATLHRFHRQYAACDDGGVGELISDYVAHTLAHRWSWLPALAAEMRADPAFGAFVLRHIDSTVDTDDLGEIRRTATALCPPAHRALCGRIRSAAARALRDQG